MKTNLFIPTHQLTHSELLTGVRSDSEILTCVVCGMEFRQGVIYPDGELLLDAPTAARHHVNTVHGGMIRIILDLPGSVTGLTDLQKEVLSLMARPLSDREIARTLGGKAESTIRNHRFQFKKRVAEARILVALADLLEKGDDNTMEFIKFHSDIPMADDRVQTTHAEAEKILGRVFETLDPPVLKRFPRKEKEKLVVLRRITEVFHKTRKYTEKEVNEILKPIYDDYATIRRYLIEYRFMFRTRDCSSYWVNA